MCHCFNGKKKGGSKVVKHPCAETFSRIFINGCQVLQQSSRDNEGDPQLCMKHNALRQCPPDVILKPEMPFHVE